MVLSIIDKSISYPEINSVDKNDFKKEADVYKIQVNNVTIMVAIGNANKTFENKKIIFFPIYLIKPNNKFMKIGLYEIKINSVMDDYSLDINDMEQPLIYSYVTTEMLNKERMIPDEDSSDSDSDSKSDDETDKLEKGKRLSYEIPPERKDIFELTPGAVISPQLKEETKEEALDNREKYHESTTDIWIKRFMSNNNYGLIDNEGGGDCLFATIRDAFSSIAQQTSVSKLRSKLAKEATEEIFYQYKEQYDMYNSSIILDTNKIKELAAEYAAIKQKFASVIDRNEQKVIAEQSKKIKAEHDALVKEKRITADILKEYRFMKGIDTLDKFKSKLKHESYWADTWAISTLEKVLNIKIVILSSENYKSGDIKNVLLCGQLNDTTLESAGIFTPEFYIMVEHTGDHYKLITYKKKQIFKFAEIPYDIKRMIVDKCLEKNAGPFALIPDFQNFKSTIKTMPSVLSKEKYIEYEDLSESNLRGLYDADIVLSFYKSSNDKPLPGKGNGEQMPNNKLREFATLAAIPQWRKKLDNFWIQQFALDNHQWSSVEHYYQAAKFKKNNSSFYLSFSLDSGTELSKDPNLAKAAGSKTGKLNKELLRPTEVTIDPDFYGKKQKHELYSAQFAKFTQNEDLKQLLLATNDAKLQTFIPKNSPEIMNELMLIRDKIRRGQNA